MRGPENDEIPGSFSASVRRARAEIILSRVSDSSQTTLTAIQALGEGIRRGVYKGEVWAAFFPLIDGRQGGGTGQTLVCLNPATGGPIARVLCAGPEEIDRAVDSAVAASALWRGTPFVERARCLDRLAALVKEQAEGIASLIALEQGKPLVEALVLEVLPALDHLRYISQNAQKLCAAEGIDPRMPLFAHKREHFLYDPLGVVALVTPFSLPFALPLIQVGAAVAMGNAAVLKPSEQTSLCALRIGELCIEAGFPPGLVNVVPAPPEDALRLIAHDSIDKVFVTGTLETGQCIMATAGCAPRPVVLSLAGKHPSIVAGDADLDRAARGIAWGALANSGQNCGAIERVYVEESVATQFLHKLLVEVESLTMGDPLTSGVDIGPLVSETRRRAVHAQVTAAVEEGARLMTGGEIPDGPGFFYPPTILLGAPTDAAVMRDETFGPVIPVVVVDSLERAIFLSNESAYALTASGWTKSAATAERLMAGLKAGVVTINDALYSFGEPAASWSGFKKSGIGHNHGSAGLREMCHRRFVSFDPQPAEAPIFAFPYDDDARMIARGALDALHGQRRRYRLRGLLKLLRSKRFRSRLPWRSFFSAWKRRGR